MWTIFLQHRQTGRILIENNFPLELNKYYNEINLIISLFSLIFFPRRSLSESNASSIKMTMCCLIISWDYLFGVYLPHFSFIIEIPKTAVYLYYFFCTGGLTWHQFGSHHEHERVWVVLHPDWLRRRHCQRSSTTSICRHLQWNPWSKWEKNYSSLPYTTFAFKQVCILESVHWIRTQNILFINIFFNFPLKQSCIFRSTHKSA